MKEGIHPPSAKPRLGEYSAPGKSSSEQLETEARSVYFDILPENALDNIVRFFSDSPRAENWPNHASLDHIYDLFDVQGELGRFLFGRFSGVLVFPAYVESMDLDRTSLANEGIIACTEEFLLKILSSFETIIVENSAYHEEPLMFNLELLLKQWPDLRCLMLVPLDFYQTYWLKILGENLDTLHVSGCSLTSMMEIAIHCVNLRVLYMEKVRWSGIDPQKFWEALGENLETISAHVCSEFGGHTHSITKHCPKIKRLELSGKDDGIPKCIAFYGEQFFD